MSIRGDEWMKFAEMVHNHIEHYTVPQYGDKGEDQCTTWTAEDCMLAIRKYAGRYGNNQREGQQTLDFLKAAHYAQMGYDKQTAEEAVRASKHKATFCIGEDWWSMNRLDLREEFFLLLCEEMEHMKRKKVRITLEEVD